MYEHITKEMYKEFGQSPLPRVGHVVSVTEDEGLKGVIIA
jgi:hypothetical protein